MHTSMQTLRDEALSLSLSERASLAHDLILSLDEPSDFDLGPAQEAGLQRPGSTRRRTW